MLKDYVPAHQEPVVSYVREFTDEHGNGFSFWCNEHGEVDIASLPPAAQENYAECLDHPERFAKYNTFVKREDTETVPASGGCSCGKHIELFNQYMGACECPHCGQWYNLFGQELLPPNQWDNANW